MGKYDKLFIRYKNLGPIQRDCLTIWEYLNEQGIPKFTFEDVEDLWDQYSATACASWLIVHNETLEGFMDWLEEEE